MDIVKSNAANYLQEELTARKRRRPGYSLRAFARDLEMSPSSLSEFLSGRQGLSRERLNFISKKIRLTDWQTEYMWDLIESKFGRSPLEKKAAGARLTAKTKSHEHRLSLEKFKFIADWYHLSILEVLELSGRQKTPAEIGKLLFISTSQVKEALQRLLRLELLIEDKSNPDRPYTVQTSATVTGDEGSQRAIQLFHEQFLQMQSEMVSKKDISERESLSVSLSIPSRHWKDFRREAKQALISILTKYASLGETQGEAKDQVVLGSFQLVTVLPQKDSKENAQ